MQVQTGTVPEHIDADLDDPDRQAIRDLMDPVALEARLVIARARRAEVLAARAKGSQDARENPAVPGSRGALSSAAPMSSGGAQAAGPSAGPEDEAPSFGLAASMRDLAAAKERRNSIAGKASISPPPPIATDQRPERRTPVHWAAAPDEVRHAVAPQAARSGKRRSVLLVTGVLLTGVALGAVSTVMLQFQGWRIPLSPPAAGSRPEQSASLEVAPATIETVVPEPSTAPSFEEAETLAGGSTEPEADVALPLVSPNSPVGFSVAASAEGDLPAPFVRPAPGQTIQVGSSPSLPPAKPPGIFDAQIAGLLQPAPPPLATRSLPALSFDMGAAAPPERPVGDLPVQPILALAMADMPKVWPPPQLDVSPPSPVETADPGPAIASQPSRIAVHFQAASPQEADKVTAGLTDAGFAGVETYPVSIRISSMQVRYFHEVDREAAEAVAASTSAAFDGAEVAVRDFTALRPQPEAGLVEVWLEGGAAAPAAQAAPPSEEPVVPRNAAEQRPVASRGVTQEDLERRRVLGTVEQLLREKLR